MRAQLEAIMFQKSAASDGLSVNVAQKNAQPEAERLSANLAKPEERLAFRISSGIATSGLKKRNRHTPRLCVACGAPLGSQEGACWRCGSRLADRHEQLAEPDRLAQSDTERWTDEGGGLVSPPQVAEPRPNLPRQGAVHVVFQVHDGSGAEILAELEERTSHRSTLTPSGDREYELSAAEVGVEGFDPILDLIDTGWREHLSRTQPPAT
jgi:hypothetical protein